MSVEKAINWAVRAHRGTLREGHYPLPYVTHPLEVMSNLRYIGNVTDEDLLCAAALHDTVESGRLKLTEIEREFGANVASLVAELTREEPNSDQLNGLSKDEIWHLRADMLLKEIAGMSRDAQIIKLADRLANVKDAHRQKTGKKLSRYLLQTKRILRVVKRSTNKQLWDAIQSELSSKPKN